LTYTLKTVSPDAVYSGGQLAISATGDITVDTNTLSNDNYYVEISSLYGASLNTNSFQVKVECGPSSNTITEAATLTNSQTWTMTTSADPEFVVDPFTVA